MAGKLDVIAYYKNKLISRGIEECESLLLKQATETMRSFYKGSINGFNVCKDLESLEDFKEKLKEITKKEIEAIRGYKKENNDSELLGRIWHFKGIRNQVDFVYQRIRLVS